MGKLTAFLFLSLVTSIAADADIKAALEKSLNFIKSQRNAHTHAWKPKESATAMLGIFSGDPTWRDRGKIDGAGHNHEVLSTIHGMELGLSSLLLRHGLDEINDALLAQYISALQVSCLDPRDFLGHDLVAEAIERIEEQRPVSVTLGPIILALCNLGVKITNPRTIKFMQRYEIEKDARGRRTTPSTRLKGARSICSQFSVCAPTRPTTARMKRKISGMHTTPTWASSMT